MKHDETPGPSADDKPTDTEGHGYKWADAEKPEDQDAEGHAIRSSADAEKPEGEDVEGHGIKTGGADAETPEGEDVEGHGYKW